MHDAVGREAHAVAELDYTIVELHGARQRVEAGDEFSPAPIRMRAFGRVLYGGGKSESTLDRKRPAPLHLHLSRRGDQRVDVQSLAQRDGRGAAAAASRATKQGGSRDGQA